MLCGSADEDGAGELSTSGEYIMSLSNESCENKTAYVF